jgi:nicotinamidase-related amidase
MVELDARLHRAPSDALLVKKYASSFFGTDPVPRLLSHGADTLVITGCSTNGCVRATAVDSCQNGFRPMVVREAVGDPGLFTSRHARPSNSMLPGHPSRMFVEWRKYAERR